MKKKNGPEHPARLANEVGDPIGSKLAQTRPARGKTKLGLLVRSIVEAGKVRLKSENTARIEQVKLEEMARLETRKAFDAERFIALSKSTPPDQLKDSGPVLKKLALIAEVVHEWKTVSADLSEASRNGLKDAAHSRFGWHVNAAKKWASSKGKLKSGVHTNSVFSIGGIVHKAKT